MQRVIDGCGWHYLTDISVSDVHRWIADARAADKAAATVNSHLRAAKSFCAWLTAARRIAENPLRPVPLLNAKADRRLERHAYTLDELGRLLAAAEAGGKHHGMTGPDRALLYRTAVESGLRWSELHSLARSSFDFESDPATVAIRAEDAKNRTDDSLPLRPELAADLRARLALHMPGARAFTGMRKGGGAEMIRVDLEAAGILSRNAAGELVTADEYGLSYDFHGLRHTFATMLNKARVPLATAQKLMRHSDPKLTAGIYTHVLVADKAEELAKLPAIQATPPEAERQAATGTGGEKMDTPRDTNTPNFGRQIRTYEDGEKVENEASLRVV